MEGGYESHRFVVGMKVTEESLDIYDYEVTRVGISKGLQSITGVK